MAGNRAGSGQVAFSRFGGQDSFWIAEPKQLVSYLSNMSFTKLFDINFSYIIFNHFFTGYKLQINFASCYKFHRALRTWFQAYVTCHEEGGELAVINSAEEAQMLQTMFKENLSPDQAIVGLRTKAGEWVTVDEEPLSVSGYDSWSPGEPNNKNGESCGFMLRSGMLNDDPCDKLAPSICEITL
ncbi:hemolymph lipopolysaccharide-binding protein-like [Cydia pomonella]|uniref:hemolymph lipopolysaccharide-binding protein-like n=1 Tax=Cydia pomonella TaxID=82600 RepID=UPI002ADD87DA|nr:hemolymph lipopolysaccharide-binding protein-like [Cydia pomonella]